MAQKTGTISLSNKSEIKSAFTLLGVGSPTKPKSTGTGERREAGMMFASTPDRPIALQPFFCSNATMLLLIHPA